MLQGQDQWVLTLGCSYLGTIGEASGISASYKRLLKSARETLSHRLEITKGLRIMGHIARAAYQTEAVKG